jgi:Sec-independent protein secretion pathway component TatC
VKPAQYAKFIVAILGAGVAAALGLLAHDSQWYVPLTVAASVLTAAGVFFVPNKDGATG